MSQQHEHTDTIFWTLWERNRDLFYKKCLRIMNGNQDDAQDALSCAMLKAREKMAEQHAQIQNFTNWALRLTENVCIDQLRKNQKLSLHDELPDKYVDTGNDDGAFLLEGRQRYRRQKKAVLELLSLICSLPQAQRDPFLLRFFLCDSYQAIAAKLCISEQTVRKRIQQTRSIVKERFGESIPQWRSISLQQRDMDPESLLISYLREKVAKIIGEEKPEIDLQPMTAWLIDRTSSQAPPATQILFLPLRYLPMGKKIRSLKSYIQQHPSGWKKYLELAQINSALGHYNEAITLLQRAKNEHPDNLQTRILLAELLNVNNNRQGAISEYDQTQKICKRQSSQIYFSGKAAALHGNLVKAQQYFSQALTMEPNNSSFHHALGTCLLQQQQYSIALEHFQTLLKDNAEDVPSLVYCSEIERICQHPQQAHSYLKRILKQNPMDHYALTRLNQLNDMERRKASPAYSSLSKLTRQLDALSEQISVA